MGEIVANYVSGDGSAGTSYYRKTDSVSVAHHAGSYIIGCESNRYRIMGYKFTTPSEGISQLSFELETGGYTTGYSSHTPSLSGDKLGFVITEGNTPPLPSNTSLGKITATNSLISSSVVTAVLKPDTTYYLWIYSVEYYQGYWTVEGKNVKITYVGGVVNIYTSNGWEKAIPWIYTNGAWHQTIPYIYNGGWKNTC